VAEFRHYTTFEEAMVILRDVAEAHHLKLIPEEPTLAKPHLETFDHFEPSLVERLARFGVVELEGAYTKHPLRFKQRDGGAAAGTYYRDDSVGPRILWTLPVRATGDRPSVSPSAVTYYKSYRDPDTNEREPPSQELKDAFRNIVKTMKKHMVNAKIRGQSVWVGRDTKRRFDLGEVVIDP
jgi:hypothetical protein